jgi:hypothetical protein
VAKNNTPLTEKVLVSTETKQALMSIREPGERYGDVIERVLQDRKRHDFIAHLDSIAKEGEFVPLDSDPEYAVLKKRCAVRVNIDKTALQYVNSLREKDRRTI